MTAITDDFMRERIAQTRSYTVVILHGTDKLKQPDAMKIVWEHGRRNFQLRADGALPIVCPISDGSDVTGVGILNASLEEAHKIMEGDPAVQAGLFTFELHACRSFPGDALPR